MCNCILDRFCVQMSESIKNTVTHSAFTNFVDCGEANIKLEIEEEEETIDEDPLSIKMEAENAEETIKHDISCFIVSSAFSASIFLLLICHFNIKIYQRYRNFGDHFGNLHELSLRIWIRVPQILMNLN